MAEAGCGAPVVCEGLPPRPGQPLPLASPAERATPGAPDRLAEQSEPAAVTRPSIGAIRPQPPASPPGALRRDGPGQAQPQGVFDVLPCLAPPLGLFPRLTPHPAVRGPPGEPAALRGPPAVERRQDEGGPQRAGDPALGP